MAAKTAAQWGIEELTISRSTLKLRYPSAQVCRRVLYAHGVTLYRAARVIYPNDHRPAHVHVIGKGCEAVFNLHCPAGPAELRENYGFTPKDLNRIEAFLSTNLAVMCLEWEQLHGDP